MRLTINFNPKNLYRDLGRLETKLDRNLNGAVRAAALLIQSESKKNISKGPRSGRIYKRRTIMHRASAPGEYPKTDTGRLVSSISTSFGNRVAYVGSNIMYAPLLEHGTRKMAPRPWLNRTYIENKVKIARLYDAAIRNALK